MTPSNLDSLASTVSDFEVIFWDLDDTIYPEIDYLTSAYDDVSKHLETTHGISRAKVFTWLMDTFLRDGRHGIFDSLIHEYGLDSKNKSVLINILRTTKVKGGLNIFPEVADILRSCSSPSAIITNGNSTQQRNKISQLSPLAAIEDIPAFFCGSEKSKPSTLILREVMKKVEFRGRKVLYVGDSPTDRTFAENAGFEFFNVSATFRTENHSRF